MYDIAQLHNTLLVGDDGDDQALMVHPGGIHALEQFVLAKHYLTTQIYQNKVRLIADNMLVRAIRLGVEVDKIRFLRDLYIYQDSSGYIENYIQWDDRRVLTELLKPEYERKHAGELFRRLVSRKLLKRVFTIKLRELPSPAPEKLAEEFPKARRSLEDQIAEELKRLHKGKAPKVNSHFVVLNQFNIESVRTQSRNSEGSIMILKGRQPIPLEQESTLFRSIDESLKESHLECYAPVEYQDERQKRDITNRMQEFITGLLGKTLVPARAKTGAKRR